MKKILICLGTILLITGCGETTKTLNCNSTTTANNLTTDITYDIDYDDDNNIKYVTIKYDYTQKENATERNIDRVESKTDTTTKDDNTNENNGIVDGVVGDAIDEGINAVTDTILDIAGIKNNYKNQMTMYDNIEGVSYKVEKDNDNQYTIVYKIDLEKINDTDLARFNIDRNLTTTQTTYENQGYTCK